jgi:DNA-binding transcriptional ArsR family regulator
MNSITFADILIICKVLIGCTKDVYRYYGPEEQWNRKIKKLVRPSQIELVVLKKYKSLERRTDNESIFSPHDLQSEFSRDVKKIDQPTVSRALKILSKVKYIEKIDIVRKGPGKPKANDRENTSGRKSYYKKTDDKEITTLLSRFAPRAIIFQHLHESDVMEQFLKFHHYNNLIRTRDTKINDLMEIEKAKGILTEESLIALKNDYEEKHNLLSNKNDKEIMRVSSKLAKMDLTNRDWQTDELYTEFFKRGFLAYRVIEQSNT